MKRISAFLSFAVLFCAPAFSQGPEEAIREDRARTGGLTYLYNYKSEPVMTPAPEGYKPFYISHFGRHGARYCTWEYDSLYTWLSAAGKAGMLTPYGEAFSKRYEAFYDKVKNCEGDLTAIGVDQLRTIATRMFWRFPEVFEGKTHVDARSTDIHRVIMSMWSFLSALKDLDPDISVSADASLRYSSWLNPLDVSNPNGIKGRPRYNAKAEADRYAYFYDTVDAEGIMSRFVISPGSMNEYMKTDALDFIRTLHTLATASKCLDEDRDFFDGIFTSEEDFLIWKTASARIFILLGNYEGSDNLSVDYSAFTLEQIIDKADKDIASGQTPLRLRFGHDSGLYPLLLFMNVNGYGRSSAYLEESLSIAPSYIVPMGSSVQFVFYRNPAGNILLKLLLNEREAALPFKAVEGPYYDWNDFKQYYLPTIAASKKKISREKALFEREEAAISTDNLDILKKTDWGWHRLQGSEVEAGHASVAVFGSLQDISLVRFPMDRHRVSVHESAGPSAGTTSALAAGTKAIAAINGSYFSRDRYPVTLIKDEGWIPESVHMVGNTRNSNGLFRIRKRNGRTVDILRISDSLSCMQAVKNWYEAMVSGPVLLEDGKRVNYVANTNYVKEGDVPVDVKFYRHFYSRRHPRTALGYTSDGWIYFIVADGRFPGQADGMSMREIQTLCEALGLYEAINLDGGGSSTLWTREGGVMNHPCDNKTFDHAGERIVPNIIIVE